MAVLGAVTRKASAGAAWRSTESSEMTEGSHCSHPRAAAACTPGSVADYFVKCHTLNILGFVDQGQNPGYNASTYVTISNVKI